MISDGVGALTQAFRNAVPKHADWRTFTVSACAFPGSMRVVDTHFHKSVERTDWISWKENLYNRRSKLVRLPSFGDCVIQHPQGCGGIRSADHAGVGVNSVRNRERLAIDKG